jgi:hypothetical protein
MSIYDDIQKHNALRDAENQKANVERMDELKKKSVSDAALHKKTVTIAPIMSIKEAWDKRKAAWANIKEF